MKSWRKTTQAIAPARRVPTPAGQYDIYPAFPLASGTITSGYGALAERIAGHAQVVVDGYGGVLWHNLRHELDAALQARGIRAAWIDINQALRAPAEVEHLVAPFVGGDDPLFGTRFPGQLGDFFNIDTVRALQPDPNADVSILYGCGAALGEWDALLVYVDVPKNEIQFRSRAGSVANLGADAPADAKVMYKRFYFVDWHALNRHKAALLPQIDVMVDEQRPDDPALINGNDLRRGLERMSQTCFRVRPWFEPGPWGGQWIKQHIGELAQDVPNYAWSFEAILPENGLAFQSDGCLLEVSFDCLMFHNHRAVLGACADRFGYEFPIRFDFLDTFDGGNLSVQCHPRPDYIRQHFGETFTQDETYYILDCKPGARVFLGFNEDIDPIAFREALDQSFAQSTPLDVERFVATVPAHKHDLFLIPHGTIHCSGTDNLVLEISATPYIFTFKLYDWLRLDLEGRPRPLNIERAFRNLNFERNGARVHDELIAKPYVLAQDTGWMLVHLPTHADHFYDVHRFEFDHSIAATTDGSPHVMSLVEGTAVLVETADGMQQRFNYAETFVVPAATGRYRLINAGSGPAKVVKAFVKPSIV